MEDNERSQLLTFIFNSIRQRLSGYLYVTDVQIFRDILRFQGRLLRPDLDIRAKIYGLAGRWGLIVDVDILGMDVSVVARRKLHFSLSRIPPLNLFLFLATCATTLFAGSIHAGVDPIADPLQIYRGIPFSATLMMIFLLHEGGHYYFSFKRNVVTTYPYFVPFPSIFGTLGAVIATRSPILNRRALFDIGASGPLCGFAISMVAGIAGLLLSPVVPETGGKGGISFGFSLLLGAMTRVVKGDVAEGYVVLAHPVLLAAWIGFFVTALNLLPVGQLDGGHVLYALIGRRQSIAAHVVFVTLIGMGVFLWPGWFVWAGVVLFVKLKHPPPVDDRHSIDRRRKIIGYALMLLLILIFPPVPFMLN